MRLHATSTALAAVLLLALTGCTSTPASAPSSPASVSVERAAPTVAPLVAETPSTEAASGDVQYLKDVRKALTNGRQTQIPNASDEQLIRAGHDACVAIATGTPEGKVSVIAGETFDDNWGGYMDSNIILTIARKYGYC